MSRILYLCHRLPFPPDKGCRIRAFHQLHGLAQRHRVHVLALAENREEMRNAAGLRDFCEAVEVFHLDRRRALLRAALGAWRPRPLTLSFFDSKPLRERVVELTRFRQPGGYDLVMAYSSSMAPYAELTPLPQVLDMVDADSAKWAQYARFAALPLRPLYALEARRLRRYEAKVAAQADKVVLATARDAALLSEAAPEAPVTTIPNGIDTDYFRPLDLPKSPHPMLVFTGQMDYFANVDAMVWFARQVFPRLRRSHPGAELVIVGRSPSQAVRDLAEIPGVVVTGTVGDVRPFLARAWVFVAPLRIAQGVQNKVLEALACELPVVCSERVLAGLAEGGFREGHDLLAARGIEELERAINGLLSDRERRNRLAANGRRRLLATYSWEEHDRRLEAVLAEVLPAVERSWATSVSPRASEVAHA